MYIYGGRGSIYALENIDLFQLFLVLRLLSGFLLTLLVFSIVNFGHIYYFLVNCKSIDYIEYS